MQKVIEQARNQTLGIKNSDPTLANISQNIGSIQGLMVNPSTNLGGMLQEADIRRRSSERDISRSSDRNRGRNRSRSRSPIINDSSYSRLHGVSSAINDRVKLEADMISISNKPMPGIVTNSAYSNIDMRSRLGSIYPEQSASQLPISAGLQSNINRNQWTKRDESYDSSLMHPGSGISSERLMNENIDRMSSGPPSYVNSLPETSTNVNHTRNFSIEMRGLPFNIVPRDILDFFHQIKLYLPEDSIKILVDDRGYTTGGAIVNLSSERDFEAAFTLNGRYMGDRRIDIMPLPESLTREQSMQASTSGMMMHNTGRSMMPESLPLGGRDYVVYMKGIPYNSCTNKDVAEFFQGIPCVDIVFEIDINGKPAGNAYVEFGNSDHFNAALDLNLKHMGRRYIELFPTTREDMNEARRIPVGLDRRGNRGGRGDAQATYCVAVNGLPPTVTNRDLTNYFSEVGAQPFAIHIMIKPNGFNAGEAFVEFANPDQQMRAIRRNGSMIGSHRISVKGVSYELMRNVVGIPPMNNGSPSFEPMRSGPPMDDIRSRDKRRLRQEEYARRKEERMERRGGIGGIGGSEGGNVNFSDPRCIVIASNIPYRATNEDICVFFSEFKITADCILRRFNDKGQTTSECKIAFRSPSDALRSVSLMHKKYLLGRPVFLRTAD